MPPLEGVTGMDAPAPVPPVEGDAPPIPPLEDEYEPAVAADETEEDAPDAPAAPVAPETESEPDPELEDQAAYFADDFEAPRGPAGNRAGGRAADRPPPMPPPMPLTGVADAVAAVETLSNRPAAATPRDDDAADNVVLTAAHAGTDDAADDDALPDFLRPDALEAAFGIQPGDDEHMTLIAAEDHLTAAPLAEMSPERDKTRPKPTVGRTLAEIPILLIVAALIAFLVKTFLAQAYYIPSGSMLPQLQIDDRVVVSKLAYKVHDPRRGDIVVFDDPRPNAASPDDDKTGFQKWIRKVGEGVGVVQPSTDEFIKRVIGLPGDHVSGHDGFVFINGHKLLEPYLPTGVETSDFPTITVASGRLWVMGDNRGGSADSRVFGQIKISTIVGRAVIKVWPFSHISFL